MRVERGKRGGGHKAIVASGSSGPVAGRRSAAAWMHVPVARGGLRRLPLALDGRGDRLENLAEPLQAHALARLLEQLQLQLGGELESRSERERRLDDVLRRHLDLGAGELDELREETDAAGHVGGVRRVVRVREGLDGARVEAPSVGQLEEPEPVAAFDDDVQPAVLEALDDLDDARQRPRPA